MRMIYIVNVFAMGSSDICKSFEVESADEASRIDSLYSCLLYTSDAADE